MASYRTTSRDVTKSKTSGSDAKLLSSPTESKTSRVTRHNPGLNQAIDVRHTLMAAALKSISDEDKSDTLQYPNYDYAKFVAETTVQYRENC